ncbi:MAG: YkvA family protein [bacterium]
MNNIKKIKKIDKNFIKKQANKITEEDLIRVGEKAKEIESKFAASGPLGRFIEDVKLLISIVKDYVSGKYRKIPYWAIASIAFALLYVLSPVDLIPDVIPVIGLTDDAAVIAVCLLLVEQELQEYKEWKTNV